MIESLQLVNFKNFQNAKLSLGKLTLLVGTNASSIPGQVILGDRGENLSSVLQVICEKPEKKRAVLEWIRQLTPLDVEDFDFVPDQTGRILLTLIETGGRRISAYSASDGTLRFLAMIAAMLGPDRARFYFIEEIDTGIHPTRLHLLLQLIEQTVEREDVQVVATTHSFYWSTVTGRRLDATRWTDSKAKPGKS